jgi:hypothetical protein
MTWRPAVAYPRELAQEASLLADGWLPVGWELVSP